MSKRSVGFAFTLTLFMVGTVPAAQSAGAGAPGIYGKLVPDDNGRGSTIVMTSAPLPTAPGPNPLSVGHMQTFVFKAPAALPAAAFNDPAGKPTSFASFKGKIVLVNLWATWCVPCRKELPDLDRLQGELGSDSFQVVAISLDRGTPDKPRKLIEEMKLANLALFHDPTARLGFAIKAIGMPVTLLLDRQGREVGRLVGPAEWASEDAKRLIRAAVAAGG